MHFGGHSAAVFITRSATTLLAQSPIVSTAVGGGRHKARDGGRHKARVEAELGGVVEMLLDKLSLHSRDDQKVNDYPIALLTTWHAPLFSV